MKNKTDNDDFSEPWPQGARKQPRTNGLRVSKQQVDDDDDGDDDDEDNGDDDDNISTTVI